MPPRRQFLHWVAPVIAAVLLAAMAAAEWAHLPVRVLEKGSRAAFTLRAPRDIALSLQDLRREEIREALERYLPVYDYDARLLERRRGEILAEIARQPPGLWRWADADETAGEPQSEAERDARRARDEARVAEVKQLAEALFPLLEPAYRDGVIADDQFPAREREVRTYADGRYRRTAVGALHRFSELRPLLRDAGQRFFFKTEERVREQVIAFVLDRLPPNVSYAKENARHIADISQVTGVKVELMRRGEVLVRRHGVIDGRVHYALRAASEAQNPNPRNRILATLALSLAACVLLVLAGREVIRPPFTERATMLALGVLVVAVAIARALLALTPLATVALPLAMVPLALGVLLGRGAGVLGAVAAVAAGAAGGMLDLTAVLVVLGSGLCAAFVTRPRRRGSAMVGSAVAAISGVAIFAACVALGLRDRNLGAIWTATQALAGGAAAGFLALCVLPVGERVLGCTSVGRLRALCDFERPLLRELRRRAPGTFAHSVALASIAESAADSVDAEPLLARAGALYHDVGKIEHPERYGENTKRPAGPDVHVAAGVAVCRKYRVPEDIVALVRQHHGGGAEAGEAPASLEAVIVLVAEAALETPRNPGETTRTRVTRVVNDAFARGALAASGATQADLWRIQEACVVALREEVREEAEPLTESFAFAEEPPQPAASGAAAAAAPPEPVDRGA
jgi:putative nucleotidyltransferase with HDIG domain